MLENGLLHLTNWTANVIMPTIAGLFAAGAIYRFSKAQPYSHMSYAALAALMCSGLLRVLEAFASQAGANGSSIFYLEAISHCSVWIRLTCHHSCSEPQELLSRKIISRFTNSYV